MPKPLQDLLKSIQGRKLENEAEVDALLKEHGLEEEGSEIAKAAIKMIALAGDGAQDAIVKALGGSADDGDGDGDGDEGGDDGAPDGSEGEGRIAKFFKALGFGKSEAETEIEKAIEGIDFSDVPSEAQPIFKAMVAMQADIQKQRDELADELKKAREEISESRIAKERDEWQDKIEKAAVAAGVDKSKLGSALQSLASDDSDAADAIVKAIEGLSSQVEKSRLFGEIGVPGFEPGSDSALAELDELAKEKVENSDGEMSIHKARSLVLKENKDLAQRYQEERRSRAQ